MIESDKNRLEQMFGQHMVDAIKRYVDHGIEPGSFLFSVLTNDLREAVGRADSTNIRLIPEYTVYFHNYIPRNCWGTYQIVSDWIAMHAKVVRETNP